MKRKILVFKINWKIFRKLIQHKINTDCYNYRTELSNLKRRLKMYEEYDAKVSNNGENSVPTYKM